MSRARGIVWRVLGPLGVALGLAAAVIGVSVYQFVSRQERALWESRQQEALRHATTTIAEFVARGQASLAFLARLDAPLVRENPGVLQSLLDTDPGILEVSLIGPEGAPLARSRTGVSIFADLFSIRQSAWYQRARAGEPFLGSPEISASGEPYLIISLPAGDRVIAGILRAEALWALVRELRFGATGITYLLNSRGVIVAHPDEQVVRRWSSLEGRPELEAILGAPSQAWSGAYVGLSGERVQGASARVPGTNWIVVSEITRSEVTRSSFLALLLLDGGILLFAVTGLGAIGLRLRRDLFGPLERLKNGAESIGGGDLAQRIPVEGAEELGRVAEAFNRMAAKLGCREAELAENARQLEEEIAARTRTAGELQLAKEAAEAASRTKSEFLARMSHEIRTPLHGVLGTAELLLLTPLGDGQRRSVETITSSGELLKDILNDVLDLAKIEAGRMSVAAVEFDPVGILRHAVGMHAATAERKGLAVLFSVDPRVPRAVIGDPKLLTQIIGNLMSNAIKFTNHGEVCVSVRRVPGPGDAAIVEYAVRDTGEGIDEAHHRAIFEDFTQVAPYLTRRHGGTGLGLSIVRRLVATMGGEITLASVPGRGSTFTVQLPFPIAEAAFSAAHTPACVDTAVGADHRVPSGSVKNGAGLRILVVDDNPMNRTLLAQMIDVLGYACDSAADGREALDAASGTRYGLILMDCQMPNLDGYETTRRIRDIEVATGGVRVPIVAVTGHAQEQERERCLSCGMDDFLGKPYRLDQLGGMISTWTRRARALEGSPSTGRSA